MQRIRFKVRYDGTEFSGSQIQPGLRTVEGTLTDGLESLLGWRPRLLFASRTDAGVHADGNVAVIDADLKFPVARLPELLNRGLPVDVAIREAEPAPPEFHPRFDAISRTYVYRFYRGLDAPVDRQRYCTVHRGRWDVAAVDELLAGLTGTHRFGEFGKRGAGDGTVECSVTSARQLEAGAEVGIELSANRFLRNMICRLASAIARVAEHKLSCAQVLAALTQPKDFRLQPAPAQGLTLTKVDY